MKYLILILVLCSGCCEQYKTTNEKFEAAAIKYCKKCGGLKAARLSDTDANVMCVDDNQFHAAGNGQTIFLGECK